MLMKPRNLAVALFATTLSVSALMAQGTPAKGADHKPRAKAAVAAPAPAATSAISATTDTTKKAPHKKGTRKHSGAATKKPS
jgi:hypothetical protein